VRALWYVRRANADSVLSMVYIAIGILYRSNYGCTPHSRFSRLRAFAAPNLRFWRHRIYCHFGKLRFSAVCLQHLDTADLSTFELIRHPAPPDRTWPCWLCSAIVVCQAADAGVGGTDFARLLWLPAGTRRGVFAVLWLFVLFAARRVPKIRILLPDISLALKAGMNFYIPAPVVAVDGMVEHPVGRMPGLSPGTLDVRRGAVGVV